MLLSAEWYESKVSQRCEAASTKSLFRFKKWELTILILWLFCWYYTLCSFLYPRKQYLQNSSHWDGQIPWDSMTHLSFCSKCSKVNLSTVRHWCNSLCQWYAKLAKQTPGAIRNGFHVPDVPYSTDLSSEQFWWLFRACNPSRNVYSCLGMWLSYFKPTNYFLHQSIYDGHWRDSFEKEISSNKIFRMIQPGRKCRTFSASKRM